MCNYIVLEYVEAPVDYILKAVFFYASKNEFRGDASDLLAEYPSEYDWGNEK